MGAVVERERAPRILSVLLVDGVGLGIGVSLHTHVVACDTVDDVPKIMLSVLSQLCTAARNLPGGVGVVEALRVSCSIVERVHALVVVCVAGEVHVDIVLLEKGFECGNAIGADTGCASIQRTVAHHDDPLAMVSNTNSSGVDRFDLPRSCGPVHSRQITGQPVHLLVHDAEWAGKLWATLVRADEAVAEIGLGVDVDKVGETMIVRIPEVADATAHVTWHTPVVDITREISLAYNTYGLVVAARAAVVA